MVKLGGDLRAPGAFELTPLHMAACIGHNETIRWLVKMGGDLRVRSTEGLTPLHKAADGGGHAEIVRILVELGGNLRARCAQGLTPLHYAVNRGHAETVRGLRPLYVSLKSDSLPPRGGPGNRSPCEVCADRET
jgi:cytohesin